MRRVLLDTDILSEILKGIDQNIVRRATEYTAEHKRFTYAAVSMLEILYGLHHKDAQNRLRRALRSFEENEVVLPTFDDYQVAGRIRGIAKQQGRQLTSDDCLIGAVASRLEIPLVTGNTAHFESMQRAGLTLVLENWRNG